MSALHEALRTLSPADFSEVPLGDLKPFLSKAFSSGQLIVESVPDPPLPDHSALSGRRARSNTSASIASSVSEISTSSARMPPPPPNIAALQHEWKPVKLNPKDNPLDISVYKLAAKDGKGTWFARRSVHEGLGFAKWKRGLEREFPETMKVQAGPGEGNIRGIGGERRIEYKSVDGVGKMEVYLLSAQFPGPTAPRDFVTMILTSDQVPSDQPRENEALRHFMVISRPCLHTDAAPRDGYVRGQYESVEYIREVSINQPRLNSASTTNLSGGNPSSRNSALGKAILRNDTNNHSSLMIDGDVLGDIKASASESDPLPGGGRARGKTISFDISRGSSAKGERIDNPGNQDELESNPVEWIMITRSDPGGSVPRFMVERGTPGGIVSDASKFLDWACAKDIEDLETDEEIRPGDEPENSLHDHARIPHAKREKYLHNYQTNGHLIDVEENTTDSGASDAPEITTNNIDGSSSMVAGAGGNLNATHTPAIISNPLPTLAIEESNVDKNNSPRRRSTSSISSVSSEYSFASALEVKQEEVGNDASSTEVTESLGGTTLAGQKDKQLKKLEDKRRKLDKKLNKAREKEANKKSEDSVKEEVAIRKAEEKHRKEVERLERKKEKEVHKVEEKRRKAAEKDEKTRILRELEEVKAEVSVLRKEKEILESRVGELQAMNKVLAVRGGG